MEQFDIFERKFNHAPLALYIENCIYFRKGDVQILTGAFRMGEKMAVRFMPDAPGEWTYCNLLTSEEEAFTVTPSSGNNHGRVVTKGDAFQYEDGTQYLPFGTTCYAWTNQEQHLQEQTVKTLAQSPFNKIRMCVFPKSMPYNNNDPEVFPFQSAGENLWNVDAPVETFWENLDLRLSQLMALGVEADLIVFHPYDRWGFAELTQEQSVRYLTYLIYRYGAYRNLWWSLANEYELLYRKDLQDWDAYGELLQQKDIYHHLISVHDIMTIYPDRPWLTHCSVQSSNFDSIRLIKEAHAGKPVMIDEFGYEGDIEYGWGNQSAYRVMEGFWHTVCRGGFATHGETFHREDEVLWWAKGGKLYGESPKRIAFLKRILEELPGGWHSANRELANPNLDGLSEEAIQNATRWKNLLDKADDAARFGFWCGTTPLAIESDEIYLEYCGRSCPRVVTLNLKTDKVYRVEVIDAWNMTRTAVEGTFSGTFQVPLPAKRGMAVLARAVSGENMAQC